MTPDAPLALEPRDYENWSRMIRVTDVPTATPQSDEEALALVRWRARTHNPALAANEVREVCGGWEGKGRARASAT